jgi:hypothetical protein
MLAAIAIATALELNPRFKVDLIAILVSFPDETLAASSGSKACFVLHRSWRGSLGTASARYVVI